MSHYRVSCRFSHVQKKIVLNFKQRCFGAVMLLVCGLGTGVVIVNTRVGVCLIEAALSVSSFYFITVSRPMNCVARKMWGIHDAVHAHKARRHFRFSFTSIPNIPKRDL